MSAAHTAAVATAKQLEAELYAEITNVHYLEGCGRYSDAMKARERCHELFDAREAALEAGIEQDIPTAEASVTAAHARTAFIEGHLRVATLGHAEGVRALADANARVDAHRKSIIGREAEVNNLRAALDEHRRDAPSRRARLLDAIKTKNS